PWNHGRLNVVERSLLGRRIAAERPAAARHVREQFELLPPDMNRYLTLFETAVKGSVLETDREGKLNLNFAKDQVETLQRKMHDEAPRSEAASAAPPAPANRPAATGAPSGGPAGPGEAKGAMGGLGGLGGGFGGGGGGMGRASTAGNRSREAADGAARRGLAADAKKAEAMDKAKFDARFKQGAIREEERLAERQMQEKRAGKPVDMNANGVLGEIDALYWDDRGVEQTRRLYRKLEATQEWAENNYYHRSIHDQNANLITVNSLWRDYAEADPAQPFLSRNFADASRNFHEMMFLLGVLDLPYEAGKHDVAFEGVKMSLKAASPMVVFHEELKPARPAAAGTPILVSQNFFRANDRYREENGERSDKFVKEEFLTHVVYGCQVVVTNPTSARQKLNVLLQIPRGAMAVANGQATRTQFVTLEPYNAQTIEYFFYFPAAGQFIHYPVHVAKNEELIASAQPFEFKVVDEPTKVDTESWEHVSQNGSPADVIAFLNKANLGRINLEKIAFRMKDKAFFEQVIGLLAERHVYHPTLWSYGFVHQATGAMGEFLKHQDAIANICGGRLQCPLLTIDPVVRHMYEHLEYKPLVNARAHTLGARRQIVNQRLYDQYHSLLRQLSYSRQLNDDDLLAVTYYLLLQDRIEEALATFGKVNVDRVTTRLQYDYLAAYVDFFSDQPKKARAIAAKYADHPVDRWRNTFAAVLAQLDEIEGKAPPAAIDPEDRQQQQTKLAATEPNFEFTVEAQQLKVTYQNLKSIRVNYYLMDVELLFSRNPFVQQFSGEFSSIRPNQSAEIKLADDKAPITIPLPEALKNKNVLVELVAAGKTRTQAYYAHSLNVQLVENYGQLRVTHAQTQKPVAKAYVKVYARANDGSVKFYKDGYTDLRGRFDYTSLNTGEIDQTNRFSLLIMSEEFGSLVREANPPRQ
ncbi:MAG TPA: hypothetical protein PLV92_01520, partial [Pirellulaceae bacterium]|nr:hypothetical protein [Pirellulaceae bacterium]